MDLLTNKELRGLTPEQLELKINVWRQKILELRLNAATKHIKTLSSDMKKLKKSIARALTQLRVQELSKLFKEV